MEDKRLENGFLYASGTFMRDRYEVVSDQVDVGLHGIKRVVLFLDKVCKCFFVVDVPKVRQGISFREDETSMFPQFYKKVDETTVKLVEAAKAFSASVMNGVVKPWMTFYKQNIEQKRKIDASVFKMRTEYEKAKTRLHRHKDQCERQLKALQQLVEELNTADEKSKPKAMKKEALCRQKAIKMFSECELLFETAQELEGEYLKFVPLSVDQLTFLERNRLSVSKMYILIFSQFYNKFAVQCQESIHLEHQIEEGLALDLAFDNDVQAWEIAHGVAPPFERVSYGLNYSSEHITNNQESDNVEKPRSELPSQHKFDDSKSGDRLNHAFESVSQKVEHAIRSLESLATLLDKTAQSVLSADAAKAASTVKEIDDTDQIKEFTNAYRMTQTIMLISFEVLRSFATNVVESVSQQLSKSAKQLLESKKKLDTEVRKQKEDYEKLRHCLAKEQEAAEKLIRQLQSAEVEGGKKEALRPKVVKVVKAYESLFEQTRESEEKLLALLPTATEKLLALEQNRGEIAKASMVSFSKLYTKLCVEINENRVLEDSFLNKMDVDQCMLVCLKSWLSSHSQTPPVARVAYELPCTSDQIKNNQESATSPLPEHLHAKTYEIPAELGDLFSKIIRRKPEFPTDYAKPDCQSSLLERLPTTETAFRLLDYFIVFGRSSLASSNPEASWEELVYTPLMIDQYPRFDWKDTPATPNLSLFAFPNGVQLVACKEADQSAQASRRRPQLYRFVTTKLDGGKQYCVALRFWEAVQTGPLLDLLEERLGKLDENIAELTKEGKDTTNLSEVRVKLMVQKLKTQLLCVDDPDERSKLISAKTSLESSVAEVEDIQIYEPKCLCLISSYPFFGLMEAFIKHLYLSAKAQVSLERIVTNLLHEIPVPPKGKIEVLCSLGGNTLSIIRNPPNKLPQADVDFRFPFRCINHYAVICIFIAICTEQKVVFCSSSLQLLVHSAEMFLSLLFPMQWEGVYMPVLPLALWDFLLAPVPFVAGIHASALQTMPRPTDVVFVDLDNDAVFLPGEGTIPELPDRDHQKLVQQLKLHGDIFKNDKSWINFLDDALPDRELEGELHVADEKHFSVDGIRKAFLRFWVKILQKYKKFFVEGTPTSLDPSEIFDSKKFLEESGAKHLLKQLVQTQMFVRFITDAYSHLTKRQSYDYIKFFDECILEKRNRSVLARKTKLEVPFLTDKSYDITEQYESLQPLAPDPSWSVDHQSLVFPRLLDSRLGPIRPIKPLQQAQQTQEHQQSLGSSTTARTLEQALKELSNNPKVSVVARAQALASVLHSAPITYRRASRAATSSTLEGQRPVLFRPSVVYEEAADDDDDDDEDLPLPPPPLPPVSPTAQTLPTSPTSPTSPTTPHSPGVSPPTSPSMRASFRATITSPSTSRTTIVGSGGLKNLFKRPAS